MLEVQQRQLQSIERLSEHLFYASGINEVRNTALPTQRLVTDLEKVRIALDPVQRALGDTIFSSGLIYTPSRMQEALLEDPWRCLTHISPLHRINTPANDEMIPVFFSVDGGRYIGWQTRGALITLFNCEFNPISTGLKRMSSVSQRLRLENYEAERGRIYVHFPEVIRAVFSHYSLLGTYVAIPSDPNLCSLSCYLIGDVKRGVQNYHTSLTTDAIVRRHGRREKLQPAGAGLFFINYTDGVGDARIVAHLGSDGSGAQGDHFYAWVAFP